LNEEITPKLDKLRQEKRAFLEFQKVETELDHLQRGMIAHEYLKHEVKNENPSFFRFSFSSFSLLDNIFYIPLMFKSNLALNIVRCYCC